MKQTALAVLFLLLGTGITEGQSIAERVADAPDGRVRMSFVARRGVCGDGRHISHLNVNDGDIDWDCELGPVRVVLRVRDGGVLRVDTYVGGRWRNTRRTVTDLGYVSSTEAATYLLNLAKTDSFADAEDAIYPAVIAAGAVVWPDLLNMARNRSLSGDLRGEAIFWLGQEAALEAIDGLEVILDDEDEEIRVKESAVFAISQQQSERSVTILIRVAQTNPHPQVRENAFFWLAESEDYRAIDLFEEVLTGN